MPIHHDSDPKDERYSAPEDDELFALAERLGERLLAAQLRVVTAESCTGGWVGKVLTDVAGSSAWFEGGYITYSNAAKMRDLGISSQILAEHGAVSEATVKAMATGALRVNHANLAIAVSGIAGPEGGSPGKPVGTVWFGAARASRPGIGESTRDSKSATAIAYAEPILRTRLDVFSGDREAIRRKAVAQALDMMLQLV